MKQIDVPVEENESASANPLYQILDPALRQNPYPIYLQMRHQAPIHWNETLQAWMLTRYEDIQSTLKDPRLSAGPSRLGGLFGFFNLPEQDRLQSLRRHLSLWALFMDPPEHTRVRSLFTSGFSPTLMLAMQPRIAKVTDDLLAPLKERGSFDAIKDLAYPLPVIVIAELLGVPAEDRDLIKGWSDKIADFLARLKRPFEMALQAQTAIEEFSLYLTAIVRERARHPRADLISQMLQAREGGKGLSEEELVGTCALLLFGGHETTTNLIGNGILALLQNPGALELLRRHPNLVDCATEEFLRYDSPVQFLARIAMEDLFIAGKLVRKGKRVINFLGAANRDPLHFPSPDTLDITRSPNRHLAFGQGIHFCVGAQLSRLESRLAFLKVLEAFPKLSLVPQTLEYREDLGFRGLKSLHLKA